ARPGWPAAGPTRRPSDLPGRLRHREPRRRGCRAVRSEAERRATHAGRRRSAGRRACRDRDAVSAGAMQIWIDADAAPRDVKDIVFRAAKRLELQTVMVANQRLPKPRGNPFIRTALV